jgi:hypothetical protein
VKKSGMAETPLLKKDEPAIGGFFYDSGRFFLVLFNPLSNDSP